MNPNELKKLKELAPLPIFLLIILFFLPSMLIDPENEALNAAAASYQGAVNVARSAVRNRVVTAEQNQKMQQLTAAREEMLVKMPDEAALPAMIDKLQQLAAGNNVSLEEVRYDFSREFDKLSVPSYRLQMNLKADYSSMRSFLAEIENLDSPVIINEIVLIEGTRYALTMRLLVK